MASSDSAARRAERRARRKAKRAGGQVPVAAPLPVAPPVVAPVESFSPEAALVEDATAVPLPSFDDFRRRDAEAAAAVARSDLPAASTRDGFGWGADGPLNGGGGGAPAVPSAAEKVMELLSFDSIDERPAGEEPYDATARLIGRGLPNKAGAYVLPYLQTGHMLLLGVLLLSSSVSYPGFPLTEVPDEYRDLLHQGLLITFAINALAAASARGIAARKQQPVLFWMAKVLLFGGLALGELAQAVPEAPPPPKRAGRL